MALPSGSAPLCFPGEVQGLLSQLLQVVVVMVVVEGITLVHHLTADKWWGQLSHALVLRAGSPVSFGPGSALLCCPSELQGLLSKMLEWVKLLSLGSMGNFPSCW